MKAVLSLSGGMDSSTLLLMLLRDGYDVTCLSFDYGQKHKVELERAKQLIRYLQESGYSDRLVHHIFEIDFGGLLYSNLVEGNGEVPEGHYEDENMKKTVVPNRNKIFSSFIQSVALSISLREKCNVSVAMGIHSGDHTIYPDTRPEFREADHKAFTIGNWETERIDLYTPYIDMDKTGILLDGLKSCDELNLDFDSVYERTMTSYKPNALGLSDYKSASSVERIEAFININRIDPVSYIDGWDVAKEHVLTILDRK